MTREEMEELKGLAASMGLYDDKHPCKRAVILGKAIKALEQEPDSFVRWVAREIFDEMWEYNKDAFAEIACRKLAKLGIVRAKGDEWELIEPQERSDKE